MSSNAQPSPQPTHYCHWSRHHLIGEHWCNIGENISAVTMLDGQTWNHVETWGIGGPSSSSLFSFGEWKCVWFEHRGQRLQAWHGCLEWRSALHMSPPWLGRREGTRNFERDGQLKCFCFFFLCVYLQSLWIFNSWSIVGKCDGRAILRYSPTSMFLISKATQIVKTGWGLNYDMISTVGEYRYEFPPEFQGG